MKHLVLLFTLLALSTLAQAQKDSSTVRNWSFEIFYSPNISYRILTTSSAEEWHMENRNNTEFTRFGKSIKFGAIRHLKGKWSIGSGLTFSKMGYKTKATPLTWITPDSSYATEIRSASEYSYTGIPVLVYYKLNKNKKWSTELIFGVSAYLYDSKNVITEIKTNGVWTSYPNTGFTYNIINLFALAGIGNSYRLNKSFLLKSNLSLNQSFTTNNNLSDTKEYLNFLDLNIGVNYTFR